MELKGYKNGGDRQAQCQTGTLLSLDEIAQELNISKRYSKSFFYISYRKRYKNKNRVQRATF